MEPSLYPRLLFNEAFVTRLAPLAGKPTFMRHFFPAQLSARQQRLSKGKVITRNPLSSILPRVRQTDCSGGDAADGYALDGGSVWILCAGIAILSAGLRW